MASNGDSTLLVFGHEANGTLSMFEQDLETKKLTLLLAPHILNLDEGRATAAQTLQVIYGLV